MARLGSWIETFPEGIYVRPADAWIDPSQPKPRAMITHGHGDHARGGHDAVLATPETLAIMALRYGEDFCGERQEARLGETVRIGDASVSFHPAGHVLGSAQMLVAIYPASGGKLACAQGSTAADVTAGTYFVQVGTVPEPKISPGVSITPRDA